MRGVVLSSIAVRISASLLDQVRYNSRFHLLRGRGFQLGKTTYTSTLL